MGGKVGAARSPLRRHAGTCHRKRVMSSHREDQTNQGHWQSQPRSLAIPNTSISDLYICIFVTHPAEDIWDASV